MKKKLLVMLAVGVLSVFTFTKEAKAQVYVLPNGTIFDSDFYAALYPDMQLSYNNGKNPERLLFHYLTYGMKEGRIPSIYSIPANATVIPTVMVNKDVVTVSGTTQYTVPITPVVPMSILN